MSEENENRLPPVLVERIADNYRQAESVYRQIVESILTTNCQDANHIEHTLDGLLGFCGHNSLLLLYRRLCRYYFDIDPHAAVVYVNMYREMFEDEP